MNAAASNLDVPGGRGMSAAARLHVGVDGPSEVVVEGFTELCESVSRNIGKDEL